MESLPSKSSPTEFIPQGGVVLLLYPAKDGTGAGGQNLLILLLLLVNNIRLEGKVGHQEEWENN